MAALPTVVEQGSQRLFVDVLDWPGWCRSVRVPRAEPDRALGAALDVLLQYRDRYAALVPDLRVPKRPVFEVVETARGDATTDYGAPGQVCGADHVTLTPRVLDRRLHCLAAAWAALDDVARSAPAMLRKGPRGGGRDRDAVIEHVHEAERAYARRVDLRVAGDESITERRVQLRQRLRERNGGPGSRGGWPTPYAIRRITWHVVDHVWEIEDRSDSP